MRYELKPNNRSQPDSVYIEDLRAVAERLGNVPLTMDGYRAAGGRFHPSSICRRFGRWTVALQLAGLDVANYNGGVAAEDAVADLRRVAVFLGKPTVTQDEYRKHGKWSPKPLRRHFGEWSKALLAAGLRPSRTWGVSDNDLFENLQELWIRFGRQPKYSEVSKPLSAYAAGTYERRFGSWRKALEAFVAAMDSDELRLGHEETLDQSSQDIIQGVAPSQKGQGAGRRTSRDVSLRLRFLVMRRDNFRCRSCGRSPATDPSVVLHVDHIKAWANGGETVLENLQTLCSECNIGKGNLE